MTALTVSNEEPPFQGLRMRWERAIDAFETAMQAADTFERLDACSDTQLARAGLHRADIARLAAKSLGR